MRNALWRGVVFIWLLMGWHAMACAQHHIAQISPRVVQRDFVTLVDKLEQVHPGYKAVVDKDFFLQEKEQARDRCTESMTRLEFFRLTASLIARVGDGKTQIWPSGIREVQRFYRYGKLLPLKIDFRDDKAVILNQPVDYITPGGELLSVNGVDIEEITGRIMRYFNGQSHAFRRAALSEMFVQYLWIVYGFEGEYDVRVRNINGEEQLVHLMGVSSRAYAALEIKKHAADYSFRVMKRAGQKVGYLDVNRCRDIPRFYELAYQVFKQLDHDTVRTLVVDMRHNPGSNAQLGDVLLQYLATKPHFRRFSAQNIRMSEEGKEYLRQLVGSRYILYAVKRWLTGASMVTVKEKMFNPDINSYHFNGQVIVLMDEYTMAGATNFCRVVKDYKLATLIGCETGDLASPYCAAVQLRLHGTGILFQVPVAQGIRPAGFDDQNGVLPDVMVPHDANIWSFVDGVLASGQQEEISDHQQEVSLHP